MRVVVGHERRGRRGHKADAIASAGGAELGGARWAVQAWYDILYFRGSAMSNAVKNFLGVAAPPGYVPGLGRGSVILPTPPS